MNRKMIVIFWAICILVSSSVEAKTYLAKEIVDHFIAAAANSGKTEYLDSLNKLQNKKEMKVILDRSAVQDCRFIVNIKANVSIEMWENKNRCEVIIKDLITKAKKNEGNTLLLIVNMSKCDKDQTVGKVYFCK